MKLSTTVTENDDYMIENSLLAYFTITLYHIFTDRLQSPLHRSYSTPLFKNMSVILFTQEISVIINRPKFQLI